MKQQFTSKDFIRDIYGESSYLEKMAIQKAKKDDPEMNEEYKSLEKTKQLLDTVELEPPTFVVNNILNFNEQGSTFETEAG